MLGTTIHQENADSRQNGTTDLLGRPGRETELGAGEDGAPGTHTAGGM